MIVDYILCDACSKKSGDMTFKVLRPNNPQILACKHLKIIQFDTGDKKKKK